MLQEHPVSAADKPVSHAEIGSWGLPHQRRAGVCMHLTSLPGDYGVGELGASAFAYIDLLRRMKIKVWQFLPNGPTAYGDSPYQPLSSYAGNPLLIDVAMLVKQGLLNRSEVAPLTSLPHASVDYGALIPAKNALLALAAGRFEQRAGASLKAARDTWFEANDARWLHDYALFRHLKTEHGERPWNEWEARYARRDPAALRHAEKRFGDAIHAIKIGQFLFDQQWQALRNYANSQGILLFGDMPIYIAFDSADAWARPEILLLDANARPSQVAGVPPDYFTDDGQLWGNPLYDWKRHAADGYAWWIARLRHSMTQMDMVRIDHFRGFEAYWAIPADARTARAGHWQKGPGDALFTALRGALGDLPIIAEDLGEITPEVDALRFRHKLPGMHVLQFLAGEEDFDSKVVSKYSACYTGTHDNDTTLGWFNGGPGDNRTPETIAKMQKAVLANTGGTARTVHLDMVRLAFFTRSKLAIAPMQDYLGLDSSARMNTPGLPGGNWRWRALPGQFDDRMVDTVQGMVTKSGRA